MTWLLFTIGLAFAADEYLLETGPTAERAEAEATAARVVAAGYPARVVRRFQLGRGWRFVIVVERFERAADAEEAARALADALGTRVGMFRMERGKPVAVDVPGLAPPAPVGVAELLSRTVAAHGGPSGGVRALAYARAVHFTFVREVRLATGPASVSHDYWRDASGRRLTVATRGAGRDSVAVVNPKGAWMVAGGEPVARDPGVLLTAVDEFAPEFVLGMALDVPSLLESAAAFQQLEGAESGTRLGRGDDELEPGLSFVDVDATSARLLRIRWVTEAGPLTCELEDWKEAAPGVVVPRRLRLVRADGVVETILVERLEVVESAPAGTFDKPRPT